MKKKLIAFSVLFIFFSSLSSIALADRDKNHKYQKHEKYQKHQKHEKHKKHEKHQKHKKHQKYLYKQNHASPC